MLQDVGYLESWNLRRFAGGTDWGAIFNAPTSKQICCVRQHQAETQAHVTGSMKLALVLRFH